MCTFANLLYNSVQKKKKWDENNATLVLLFVHKNIEKYIFENGHSKSCHSNTITILLII